MRWGKLTWRRAEGAAAFTDWPATQACSKRGGAEAGKLAEPRETYRGCCCRLDATPTGSSHVLLPLVHPEQLLEWLGAAASTAQGAQTRMHGSSRKRGWIRGWACTPSGSLRRPWWDPVRVERGWRKRPQPVASALLWVPASRGPPAPFQGLPTCAHWGWRKATRICPSEAGPSPSPCPLPLKNPARLLNRYTAPGAAGRSQAALVSR